MENSVHFIVYDNRSGSTLLSALLNQFLGVHVTPECDFPHRILEYPKRQISSKEELDKFFQYMEEQTRLKELNVPIIEFKKNVGREHFPLSKGNVLKSFINVYKGQNRLEKKALVIKSPNLYFHLEELSELFPKTSFIHIYRDGRAVFNSKAKSIDGHGKLMSTNPYSSAQIWTSKIKRISKHASVTNVKYEDLVCDTEQTLNDILDDLEVTFEERRVVKSQEQYFQTIGDDQTHLHQNLLKKPDINHLDKWKKELEPLVISVYETVAKDVLIAMGYTLESQGNARIATLFYQCMHVTSKVVNALKYLFQGRLKYKLKYQISRV